MSLDGAKLICLNEAGEHGRQIEAKGRKFSIGYYTTSDCILLDSRAMGVHCEIQVDPFGRVLLCNLSDEYPISFNDQVITKKRPLFKSGTLKILDKNYLWEFPSTYNMVYEDAADMVETTPKQTSVPKPSGFSCPEFMVIRGVQKRFTVHNFGYCIRSDDESNMSSELSVQQDSMSSTTEEIKNDVDEASTSIRKSIDSIANNSEPVASDETKLTLCTESKEGTPQSNLISSTPNKIISWTQKKHKLVTLCGQSDMVVTSFSPRETGVRAEKSFTAVLKAKTMATPTSVYSTPKSILEGLNTDDSHDFIDFSTPVSSKKWQHHLATNSSMHLLDFTTPGRLRPISPHAKSALKLTTSKINVTPIVTKITTKQLGLSTLQETSNVETPNSAGSIISVASSPSIIEISDATPNINNSNASASGIEVSDVTPASVSTSKPSSAKESVHVVNKAITGGISTPKRTPQLLMKRALLTSARKQHEASISKSASKLQNRLTTTTGNALTPNRSIPRALPASTSAATKSRLLSQSSDVKFSTTVKKVPISKLSKLDIASTSKAAANRRSMFSFRTGSERRSQLPLPNITPAGRLTSKIRSSAKTSPLRGVRKSFSASLTSVSQISKPRPQTTLSRSTQLLAKARRSLCMSVIDVNTRKSISMISGKSVNPVKPTQTAKVVDPKLAIPSIAVAKQDVTVGDELNRTFTIDSDEETEVENNIKDLESEKSYNTNVEDTKKMEIKEQVDDVGSDIKIDDIVEEPIDIAEINVTLPDSINVEECKKLQEVENVDVISESFGEVLEVLTTEETTDESANFSKQNTKNEIDLKTKNVKFTEHTEETKLNDVKRDARGEVEVSIREDKQNELINEETVSGSVNVVVEKDENVSKEFDEVENVAEKITGTNTDEAKEASVETEVPPENVNVSSKSEIDVNNVNKEQADITLIEQPTITVKEEEYIKEVLMEKELDPKETATNIIHSVDISEKEPVESVQIENELDMKEFTDVESGSSEGTADLLEQIEYVLNKSDELEQKQHHEKEIEAAAKEKNAQAIEIVSADLNMNSSKDTTAIEADKPEENVPESVEVFTATEDATNTIETEEKENRHNLSLLENQVEKTNKAETPILRSLRDLYKINEKELKTPRFAGLRELMRTPKIKHNRSELDNLEGISSLLRTPNTELSADKETPTTSSVKLTTVEQSAFTPRRSTRRRASMSAEISMSSVYTPKRLSRRASTSATETAPITFTPKRITTRRSSISLDTDAIPPTPDARTPRPKRIVLIEENLKDMNAIAEEECVQEEEQEETEGNQNNETITTSSLNKAAANGKRGAQDVELVGEKKAEIDEKATNKKINAISDEEIMTSTTTKEIHEHTSIIEENICEEINDFTTMVETEIQISQGLATATPTIRTVSIQEEVPEDFNVASQDEVICADKKSINAKKALDDSAYNYGEEIDESKVIDLEDTTIVIDDQNGLTKNNEVQNDIFEITDESSRSSKISLKEEIEKSATEIEVESEISASGIDEKIEIQQIENDNKNAKNSLETNAIHKNINFDKEDAVNSEQTVETDTESSKILPDIQKVEEDKESNSADFEIEREEKHQTINSPQKLCTDDTILTPIKDKNPESIQNDDKHFIGMRELLKTPKYCSTPRFRGLKEMMKTPKACNTPNFDGIKELMDTSTRSTVKNDRFQLELKDCSIFTTPSAKNVMIPNEPLSVVLDRNPDSVELCNLADSTVNYAENVTADVGNVFQTTISKQFTDNTLNTVECPTTSTCRKTILNVDNSATEFIRNKGDVSKTPPSPFSATDVISDLSKNDVQKWVDNLETSQNARDNDVTLHEEEEQNLTITEKSTENISKKDRDTTIDSEGLINVSTVSSMLDPLSGSVTENNQSEVQIEMTEVVSPIKQVTPSDMSGINLLDQTNDESNLLEPLLVSDTDDSKDELEMLTVKNKDALITEDKNGKECLVDESRQKELSESSVWNESDNHGKSVKKVSNITAEEKFKKTQEMLRESVFEDTDDELSFESEFSNFIEYATGQTPEQHRKRANLSHKASGAIADLQGGTNNVEDTKLSLLVPKTISKDIESVEILVAENEVTANEINIENEPTEKIHLTETDQSEEIHAVGTLNEKENEPTEKIDLTETDQSEEIHSVKTLNEKDEDVLNGGNNKDATIQDSIGTANDSIEELLNSEKEQEISSVLNLEEHSEQINKESDQKMLLVKNEMVESESENSRKAAENNTEIVTTEVVEIDSGIIEEEEYKPLSGKENCEELAKEESEEEINSDEYESRVEHKGQENRVKIKAENAGITVENLVETKDELVECLPKEDFKNENEIETTNNFIEKIESDKFDSIVKEEEEESTNNEKVESTSQVEIVEDLLETKNENTDVEEKCETVEEEPTIQEESQSNGMKVENLTNDKEKTLTEENLITKIEEVEDKMVIEEVTEKDETQQQKEMLLGENESTVPEETKLESNVEEIQENELTSELIKTDEKEQVLAEVILEETIGEKALVKELHSDKNENIALTSEEQQTHLKNNEECEETTTEKIVKTEKLQNSDNVKENQFKTNDKKIQSEVEIDNNIHIVDDATVEVKEETLIKDENGKAKLTKENDIEQNASKANEKLTQIEPTRRLASRRKKATSESTDSVDVFETEKPKRSNRRRAQIDVQTHEAQAIYNTTTQANKRKRKNTEDTTEQALPVEAVVLVTEKSIVDKESTEEEQHEAVELPKKKPTTRRRGARGDAEKVRETPTITSRRVGTRHHNEETMKKAEDETEKEDTKITETAKVIEPESKIVDLTSQDEDDAPLEVIKETVNCETELTKPIPKTTKAPTSTRRKRQVAKATVEVISTDTSTAEEHSSASMELPLATSSARKNIKRERTPAIGMHDEEESIALPTKKRIVKRAAQTDETTEEQHTTPKLQALPRRTRKASALNVPDMSLLQESAVDAELQTSKQSRHQPRRAAAAQRHNYDESSDSEVHQRQTRTNTTATISQTDMLQSLTDNNNTSVGIDVSMSTTRGGRTRKPTARVQQFLEEERAKTSTPKRRAAIVATPTEHNATSTMEIVDITEKMPAKRARKLPSSNSLAKQTLTSSTPPSTTVTDTTTVTSSAAATSTRRRRGRALRIEEAEVVTATAITPTIPAHICADDDIEAQEKAEESQRPNQETAKQTPVKHSSKRTATRRGKTTTTTPSTQNSPIATESVITEETLSTQTNATSSASTKKQTTRTRRAATKSTTDDGELTIASVEEKPKATTRRRGIKAKTFAEDVITNTNITDTLEIDSQQQQKEEQAPHQKTQTIEVPLSPNVTLTATSKSKRAPRRKRTESTTAATDATNDDTPSVKGNKSTTASSARRKAVHFESAAANVEVATANSGISADVVSAVASTVVEETVTPQPPPVKRTLRTRRN